MGSELAQGWSKSLKLGCGMDLEIRIAASESSGRAFV